MIISVIPLSNGQVESLHEIFQHLHPNIIMNDHKQIWGCPQCHTFSIPARNWKNVVWDYIACGMPTKQIYNPVWRERWMQSILTIKCDGIHIWWDKKEMWGSLPFASRGRGAVLLPCFWFATSREEAMWNYQSVSWGICYAKGEESQRQKRYTGWLRGSGWAVQWHEGRTLIREETDIASSLLCDIDNRPPS